MSSFTNRSIIEKLPKDHFGQVTEEVIGNLLGRQNAGIYGLPGYGRDYFAKQIYLILEKEHPEISVIFLNMRLDNDKVSVVQNELKRLTKTDPLDEVAFGKYLKSHKIIVIINEVSDAKQGELFKYLSALRAINQTQFTVLVAANYTIYTQTDRYLKYSESIFFPLKRIDPFDIDRVKQIIQINNTEYNWQIPLDLTKKIYFLSGGNPALVKHICMILYEEGFELIEQPQKLAEYQPLKFRISQIAKLTTELSIEQQIYFGLITSNGSLFSSLLAQFLKSNEIDGMHLLFPDLTKTDRRILTLFVQNPNKIIDKEQLSIILEQSASSYSEWAIYKAVARLRDKVKDRYAIQTLKGRGWKLQTN